MVLNIDCCCFVVVVLVTLSTDLNIDHTSFNGNVRSRVVEILTRVYICISFKFPWTFQGPEETSSIESSLCGWCHF